MKRNDRSGIQDDGCRAGGVTKRARSYVMRLAGVSALVALLSGPALAGVSATGGAVTGYTANGTNYTVHIFNASGTLTVSSGGQVEYLIVGGGGAGANEVSTWSGAGGGAGGVLAGCWRVRLLSHQAAMPLPWEQAASTPMVGIVPSMD